MQVKMKGNFSRLERLPASVERQIKFAAPRAINDTLFEAKYDLGRHAASVFDRPIKMTTRGGFVDKAPRKKWASLVKGAVYLKDELPKGVPPGKYLRTQIEGGQRHLKRSEVLLKNLGILRPGEFLVPHTDYQNAHGNVRLGLMQQMLSDLRAYQHTGSVEQNRPLRYSTGARNTISKPRFYIMTYRGSKRGIFEDIGSMPKLVMSITRIKNYSKRYYFHETAEKSIKNNFTFFMRKHFRRAMLTAKI